MVALLILVALVIAVFLFRWIYTRVLRSRHAIGEPGIDEAVMADIGGIKQYVYIRGEDRDNPVMLFIHGGPGTPMIGLMHAFQYGWEKYYTVVQWDQRMAGKTYYANDKDAIKDGVTFEQMVEDAYQVAEYVRQKMGKERIIILGHSWGTVLGTILVQQHPEVCSAYIGVSQMIDMKDNEAEGFRKLGEAIEKSGKRKDMQAYESMKPYPPDEYDESFIKRLAEVRKYQAKYGLASGMGLGLILQGFVAPYYSLKESMYYFTDTSGYLDDVFKALFEEYNARNYGTEYKVPVIYIMGANDYQTPITLAREYFDDIHAPKKRFYRVEDAGHFTMLDNKSKFEKIIREIKPLVS